MPIYKGTLKTGAAYKGSTSLSRIYKGAYLVFEAFKTLIAEGVPPLILLNCAAEIMLDYRVYGNSIQDGSPTPDTPIEIESVGDKTKNLFDKSTYTARSYYINNASTGTEGVYIEGAPSIIKTLRFVPKKNTTYTVSKRSGNIFMVFASINEANANVSAKCLIRNNDATSLTFNSGEYNYIEIAFWRSTDTITYEKMLDSIQIEEGSTTTDYEPYGYRIPVKVSGLNLWDEQWELGGLNSTTGIPVASDYSIISKNFISVSPGETYFIRGSGNERIDIYQYDSTKTFIQRNTRVENKSLTSKNNTYYIKLYLVGSPESPITTYNNDICINKSNGLINGNYEPYYEPRTTNIYLSEPLRKIDNYIDYIDFETGKVYRNVKKINLSTTLPQFNFSTSWDNEDYTTCYFRASDIGFSGIMSNYFKSGISYQSNVYDNQIVGNYGNGYIYIKIAKAIATSKTELNNWLNTLSTPVEIIYQLASTTEESIELPDILLNKGTNIISVDTTIAPSNMWIKYKGKA